MKCVTELELCVPQNSSDGFTFYITENGQKQNLMELYTRIMFLAKRSMRSPDSDPLFPAKVYDITDPAQTDLDVFFTPEDLTQEAGVYYWELKGFRPAEDVARPIAMGPFKIQRTVIRSTDGEVSL